jgi:hypothetical protein
MQVGSASSLHETKGGSRRRQKLLSGAQFRAELTNLMRWRLEKDLGYEATLTFHVTNTGGSEIFDMIFATDHWAGEKITTDLYNAARRRQSELRTRSRLNRRRAKLEDRGIFGLFDMADHAPQAAPPPGGFEVTHEPFPPHPPYRLPH